MFLLTNSLTLLKACSSIIFIILATAEFPLHTQILLICEKTELNPSAIFVGIETAALLV
jgi:hypothetical protein